MTAWIFVFLSAIFVVLTWVINRLEAVMATLQELKDAIAQVKADTEAEKTVNQSAITLLLGLKDALDQALAGGTPDEIVASVKDIAAELESQTSDLATAVTANTPAAATP